MCVCVCDRCVSIVFSLSIYSIRCLFEVRINIINAMGVIFVLMLTDLHITCMTLVLVFMVLKLE